MSLRTKSLILFTVAPLFLWGNSSLSDNHLCQGDSIHNQEVIGPYHQFSGEILTPDNLNFLDGLIWSVKLLANHPDIEEMVPGYAYSNVNSNDTEGGLIIRPEDLHNVNNEFLNSVRCEILPLLPQDSPDDIAISIGLPLPNAEPDVVFWSRCKSDEIHTANTLCYDALAASPFIQHKSLSNYSRANLARTTN